MLHLSLLTLPRRASRWQFLQPYQLHQLIWKGFPDLPRNSETTPFLYRHDEHSAEHCVLVQSVMRPDWSAIADGTDAPLAQMREFDPSVLKSGTRLRFFVRANPVVRRQGYEDRADRKHRGRHIAVGSDRTQQAKRLGVPVDTIPTREEQLLAWLQRKGAEGGFDVAYATVGPNHDALVKRPGGDTPMTFTTVDFDGILVVREPATFAATVANGIGRGKAFGFGLLSVKRA